MTTKERREITRLHNRIAVLEAERQRQMTIYVSQLHTIVEMETALKNAQKALLEAAGIIQAVLGGRN